MTTTALPPTVVAAARRTVADELRTLGRLLAGAQWPPWTDPRFEEAVAQLRRTLDEQVERNEDELPVVAGRLGLEFEALERMAASAPDVQRWVTILAGSTFGGYGSPAVIAELLIVNLFPDELAYIGLLARAMGPAERAAAVA